MAVTTTLKFRATPGMKGYQPGWVDGSTGEVEIDEAKRLVKDFPHNFEYAKAVAAPAENKMTPPPVANKAVKPGGGRKGFGGKGK